MSLLDLPNNILLEIISLVEQQQPPCELPPDTPSRSVDTVRQVNSRLRSLACELFARKHVILNLRTFRTENEMGADWEEPMMEFLSDSELTRHLRHIPNVWKSSTHPPDVVRLDLWSPHDNEEERYLREDDFICTLHGLTLLLQVHNNPTSSYVHMIICYTFSDKPRPQSQLFLSRFELCELKSDDPAGWPSEDFFPNYTTILQPQPKRAVGQALLGFSEQSYIGKLNQVFKLADSCVKTHHIHTACWVLVHFGELLLTRRNDVVPLARVRLRVFFQFEEADWYTNESLGRWFEIRHIASQMKYCIDLAWCILSEPHLVSGNRCSRRLEFNSKKCPRGEFPGFGLTFEDAGDLWFMESLRSQVSQLHSSFDITRRKGILYYANLAYQGSGRNPPLAKAYQRMLELIPPGDIPPAAEIEGRAVAKTVMFTDIDGKPCVWSGSDREWHQWQDCGIAECRSTPMVQYVLRAQELAYRGKSYLELKDALLERFCRNMFAT